MPTNCPVANPLGLVLSGGGALGAFEVGVWQTMENAGIASNVTAISGTSIGAINAALFATHPKEAEKLWLENMEGLFAVNTNCVGRSLQESLDTIGNSIEIAEESGNAWNGFEHFLRKSVSRAADGVLGAVSDAERHGILDSCPIADVLDSCLPTNWPSKTPDVYATAVEKGVWRPKTWLLNEEPHNRRILMLRASAAMPVAFDTVQVDGKNYVDGGCRDNAPLEPLLKAHSEIKTVIVVYLEPLLFFSLGRSKNVEIAQDFKVNLIEIIPSENIGGALNAYRGVFDASPETAKRLIELGRRDAEKVLREKGLIK